MRARRTAVAGTRVFSHVYLREAESSVLVSISPRPAVFHGVVARAPRFLAQRRARETARGRPHLRVSPRPSSLATMVSFSTRFLAALVVAAWAFAFAPGASASFHVEKANFNVRMPASIKGTYEMSIANFGTPLYGATLACVLPRRRASFPRAGAALAPRRAPASDDPERRSLFPLAHAASRSRAPIERLPALTHPRPPLPPRSGTLAYPPSDKDACDPFGVRARRAFSSLSRRLRRAVVRSEDVLSFFRLLRRRRA